MASRQPTHHGHGWGNAGLENVTPTVTPALRPLQNVNNDSGFLRGFRCVSIAGPL
jgi:hypothetical protein